MIAFDLGSNTLRAVEIDCQSGERKSEFEKIVRTADQMHKTGRVSTESIARIVDAIQECQKHIEFSPDCVIAATTAAVRNASNQKEVLETLRQQIGISFQVIDGQEEAYFTTLAVHEALKRLEINDSFALIDIGGGSTELILYDDGKIISQSFDIGIVTIAQTYQTKERIASALPELMEEMSDFMQDMRVLGNKPKRFVATAGTPTTVAAIMQGMDYASYDYTKINGLSVSIHDLERELGRLLRCSPHEREKLVGVGRSDLIIAGILIFKELYRICRFDSCTVIDDGLREGLAIAKCRDLI